MEKISGFDIAKILVGPAIALFVAIVGWGLTASYNSAQRDLATQRTEADIEIARTNAAMRYVELLRDIPEEEAVQRRLAISIAAPVLPADLAFRLAIDQLPEDQVVLDVVMRKFRNEGLVYLASYLDVPFSELKRTIHGFSLSSLDPLPTESESRAVAILRYLRQRGQSRQLFNYLIADEYTSESFRPIALLLYLYEYRNPLDGAQWDYRRRRTEEEFRSYLGMSSLSAHTKQAIAFAGSIALGQKFEPKCDFLFREAASRFWDKLDVARSDTPVEGSFEGHLYAREFQENYCVQDAKAITSAGLRDRILGLNMGHLGADSVRLLLYSYAESPTVGAERAPYLVPSDVVKVMRVILHWANTPERRMELSMMLGSLSGRRLFFNMISDEDHADCEAARVFAEMLFDWYEQYHSPDWFVPEFFHAVVNEFPDLENQVHRDAWGLGNAWPLEQSRGCRP